MPKNLRIYRAVIVIVVLSLVTSIVFIFSPLSKIAAIGFEYLSIKIKINNPYVDSDYENWQAIVLDEGVSFMIPEEWSVCDDDGIYTFLDSSGEPWAYGTYFRTEEAKYTSYKEFLEEITKTQPDEIEFTGFSQFIMMDGSDILKMNAHYGNASETYFCIQLLGDHMSTFSLLLSENLAEDAEQFDIAEALVYSHAFSWVIN